jgi:hypothetical protein
MINHERAMFNAWFTQDKYQKLVKELNETYNHEIGFRISESPVFFEKELVSDILKASESIVDFLVNTDIKSLTEPAIEEEFRVPNEDNHTMFLAIDFGICEDEDGRLVPKLIEMQGFPSLFNYMPFLGETWKKHYPHIPENYTYLLTEKGLDYYKNQFKRAILNGHDPKNVVLLEIEPETQPTAIDFYVAEKELGIKMLCISQVIKKGKNLFYLENDELIPIKRIYNRVIFDELKKRTDLKRQFNLTEEVDVEWAGHPNWFARISKFLLPYLPESRFIPECKLLSQYQNYPSDLQNYVLKPLFSFSGTGVIIDVTKNDLEAIPENEKHLYKLQRKVNYVPLIETTEGDGEKVKLEFRVLYLWQEDEERPEPMIHLLRMSKGKMIGVKYNKNKTWVGSSVAFFEL